MKNKNFQKIISSLIVVSLAFAIPYFRFAQTVKAQGISGYISGLAPAISQLPLCNEDLTNGVKNLFSGGISGSTSGNFENPFSNDGEGGDSYLIKLQSFKSLDQENSIALNEESAVEVKLSEEDSKNLEKSAAANTATAKATKSLKDNDSCLKSIGRMVIKMLLQKITLSTVEWINGGYEGSPKFVQDYGEFFKDIAKNEILQFGMEINNPTLYPFGKAFLQNQAIAFQTHFAQNAQYSLNEMIQETTPEYNAASFQGNFSMGGWNAWNALTQVPSNNPLGFNLMASNELGRRLEGTSQSTANETREALQQAGGYLGDMRCTDPEGVTQEEHQAALIEQSASSMGPYQYRKCNKWEYVTPGKMVADAATTAFHYPNNNLLNAEDLNDAIAAILDAMISNFSSDIINKGFAKMNEMDNYQMALSGQFILSSPDNMIDYGSSQVMEDYSEFQIASSSFLSGHRGFNIRNDLNQALIDEQRIFVEKLSEQNRELKSKDPTITPSLDNGFVTGNYGLIPTIYQLDYCIPGPHPGFEIDSRNALNAALGAVVPETMETLNKRDIGDIKAQVSGITPASAAAAGATIGGIVGSFIPVIGTAIGSVIGAVVGAVVGWIVAENDPAKIRAYYAGAFSSLTGAKVDSDKNDVSDEDSEGNLYSKQGLEAGMNRLLDRYIELIYEFYKPETLPLITNEAYQKYLKVKGYNQMYANNEERIVAMQSIIVRLTEIKNQIDTLNEKLAKKEISDEEYEDELMPWKSSFARISAEMVSGDDIAYVENTIKQIIDERDYVYNDLLKGPNGCEQDLEKREVFRPWQWGQQKRAEYPGPILYDYNGWTAQNNVGTYLPDPGKSGYVTNKMRDADKEYFNTSGPGFLSTALWQPNERTCEQLMTENKWAIGCIKTTDAMPVATGVYFVGMVNTMGSAKGGQNGSGKITENSAGRGIFESMIGVF